MDFMHILGQKETTWNNIFSIFERRRGQPNVVGPEKTFPPSLPLDGRAGGYHNDSFVMGPFLITHNFIHQNMVERISRHYVLQYVRQYLSVQSVVRQTYFVTLSCFVEQGRIYSKPGPIQKKMWGPRAPNTIIGLLSCYSLQFPV